MKRLRLIALLLLEIEARLSTALRILHSEKNRLIKIKGVPAIAGNSFLYIDVELGIGIARTTLKSRR
jgi:hypothetical protein